MTTLILQLEASGIDSILDLGLSKVAHRKKFIDLASSHDLAVQILYLDIESSIRRQRVTQRNSKQGDTFAFEVTAEQFDFMEGWFEPLTTDEQALATIMR